jgi:hypothetical protein
LLPRRAPAGEPERLIVILNRSIDVAHGRAGITPILKGLGIAWFQAEGLGAILNGAVEIALRFASQSPAVKCLG